MSKDNLYVYHTETLHMLFQDYKDKINFGKLYTRLSFNSDSWYNKAYLKNKHEISCLNRGHFIHKNTLWF